MPASEQLERLLYILPAASREGGATLKELARTLETDEKTILKDLQEATGCTYYKPAGWVEPFTILIARGRVHVHAKHDFNRPTRLTERETIALTLGLRALAAEAEPARRDAIVELAARLEASLETPDIELRHHAAQQSRAAGDEEVEAQLELAFDADDVRGKISDAIQGRQCCTIDYVKPADVKPSQRRIAPYSLIHANGQWYVAARDSVQGELRLYRLDRIAGVCESDETFAEDPEVGEALARIAQRGFPYLGDEDAAVEVTVAYSPRIARWVREEMPAIAQPDGSAIVRHKVADPSWLIRHVLQYGGEAVVQEGALRQAVAEVATRLSA